LDDEFVTKGKVLSKHEFMFRKEFAIMREGSGTKSNVLGVRFWYTGIRVKDLEESIRFYREALGFHIVLKGRMIAHEGTYVHMRTPTASRFLN
jgi:hypothetical protein